MNPSITNQPVFRPKTNREVYMEDIEDLSVAIFNELEKRGIEMPLDDENKFHDSVWDFLSESFGNPEYRNYN